MKTKLNYKKSGQGDPLIILHGLFGTLDNWSSFAKSLSDHHTVYLVDQRNHGRSFHSPEFNYTLLAQDLYGFIQDIGTDNAHIIGHSMGGKVAMQFASDYPAQCLSLTVVDIAPKRYRASHLEIFNAILSINLRDLKSRSDAEEALATSINDMSVRQFLLKNLGRNSDGSFEWKANFKALYDHYDDILANINIPSPISVPSLFVRGLRSEYILPEDFETIKAHFTNSDIVSIDAGHWVHAERPEELKDTFLAFVERNT